jgi:hypothetical protein
MPSDYGSKLSLEELNDLVSYLMSVANAGGPKIPAKENEWDE